MVDEDAAGWERRDDIEDGKIERMAKDRKFQLSWVPSFRRLKPSRVWCPACLLEFDTTKPAKRNKQENRCPMSASVSD